MAKKVKPKKAKTPNQVRALLAKGSPATRSKLKRELMSGKVKVRASKHKACK